MKFELKDVDMTGHSPLPLTFFADHELFLSFNDDDQCIAFVAWLNEEGFELFKAWAELNGDEYI